MADSSAVADAMQEADKTNKQQNPTGHHVSRADNANVAIGDGSVVPDRNAVPGNKQRKAQQDSYEVDQQGTACHADAIGSSQKPVHAPLPHGQYAADTAVQDPEAASSQPEGICQEQHEKPPGLSDVTNNMAAELTELMSFHTAGSGRRQRPRWVLQLRDPLAPCFLCDVP